MSSPVSDHGPGAPYRDATGQVTPAARPRVDVSTTTARGILTKASGFMSGYDFTLNPYAGCAFGCTYCYAASFATNRDERDQWGYWVRVKENAVDLLRRRRGRLTGSTIYMSSVTDPYQPVERRLGLVRELLEELAAQQPRLVIQTRSPLVTRDLDLLRRFEHVTVNMTVTTDSEKVRRAFEPQCPSNRLRLSAAAKIRAAGVTTVVTMTPLLPLQDPEAFAAQLLATGVDRFVVQPFHPERGKFVAGTREQALRAVRDLDWTQDRYLAAVEVLRRVLPRLREGREGFAPDWLHA
jgi:DNA repair photolyase